jgi:ATP-dependent DNA ligase
MFHLKHDSNHPDCIFELKYDGFGARAVIEHGHAQLQSRNWHPFASFSALAELISNSLPNARAVIDGERAAVLSGRRSALHVFAWV